VKKLLVVAIVGSLIWYAQSRKEPVNTPPPAAIDAEGLQPERDPAKEFAQSPSGSFNCDGRTRCPQMRSCEEAEFYLRNCPNVRMDGDTDGIPCEDQWCRHAR
jgi:hypothetical protein